MVFPDPEAPTIIFYMDDQVFLANLDWFLLCLLFWLKPTFLYLFITMFHLISSFLHTKSLFIPYAYVSFKSINWYFLSSFELKAILLISSVQTLCFSLLNLFCDFNVNLLFMNYLWSFLRVSTLALLFLNVLFHF